MSTYTVRAIDPRVLDQLRRLDDAGQQRPVLSSPAQPLRCCLRKSVATDRIQLVSYAPLRRWTARHGVDPGAYDETGPVFIHAEECPGPVDSGVPEELRGTRRVCRGYSVNGRLLGGRYIEPGNPRADQSIEEAIAGWSGEAAVLHLRAVEYGCFFYEIGIPLSR